MCHPQYAFRIVLIVIAVFSLVHFAAWRFPDMEDRLSEGIRELSDFPSAFPFAGIASIGLATFSIVWAIRWRLRRPAVEIAEKAEK